MKKDHNKQLNKAGFTENGQIGKYYFNDFNNLTDHAINNSLMIKNRFIAINLNYSDQVIKIAID